MNALFVAWRSDKNLNNGWSPVGRLVHEDGLYRFWYTRGANQSEFKPFPQMENLHQIYESEELFPIFANRLLSKSRPEYESFLRWGGFDPNNPPDPIVMLGVTEGIRQTDAIEVFPSPIQDGNGCFLNKFFLHGIRWLPKAAIERIGKMVSGERLKLMLDVQNENDPCAVSVRTVSEPTMIGYVPRYLATDVCDLFSECQENLELFVERVNPDAPLQNRVLCRMKACWLEHFSPCSSDNFVPIPSVKSQRLDNKQKAE